MTLTIVLLIFLSSHSFANINNNEIEECNLTKELKEEIKYYQPIANKIIDALLYGEYKNSTYNHLANFIDKFGNRMTGTKNLENAIDYMLEQSKNYGLENVHYENVSVPYWIRGNESATLLKPRFQNLPMLGLGSSIGTSKEGIIASVIVVKNFDELKKIGNKAQNKIVVFNANWISYGETVLYRVIAASEASKYGALAALVRSVTPFSLNTPHTGHQSYEEGVKKIPVACITPADANMLNRMYSRGENIIIKLKMDAYNADPKTSRNTIAEIEGTSDKEKIVVVSGHLDSWDVGQGAMDDGGGAFLSWNTMLVLKGLGLRPRRTMRVILWTGEEQGYVGATQYVKEHKNEINELDFVMESDSGTFVPNGLEFSGTKEAACIIKEILGLLKTINATNLRQPQDGGPDISIWTDMGVPGASLWSENSKYYWYHHSGADTMDIEDPDILNLCTALWATVSYVVADLSIDIPKHLLPSDIKAG